MSGWDTGRPIYHRLPIDAEQYQGNPVVDAITTPYDEILMGFKAALDNFETNFLNPDTARSDVLDWLAQLVGFTGEYWQSDWTDTQKRKLIKNAHLFIWRNKGTERLLLWLLNDVFGFNAQVYSVDVFAADISVADDPIGGDGLSYYVLMPIEYETTSAQWRLAERINRLYMPVFTDSAVVYDDFYADLSGADDPILS